MTKGTEIKQGESLDLEYSWDGKDLTGFECEVMVKLALEDEAPLVQLSLTTLAEDKKSFTGMLSKDTTDGLPIGDLLLLAEIKKDSTGQGREFHQTLRVSPQGVF